MANIIAVIWDCDKTLVDGYMQDPIFEEYGIDPTEFWKEVNAKPKEYEKAGIRVNKDTYLSLIHILTALLNMIFLLDRNGNLAWMNSQQNRNLLPDISRNPA